MKLDPKPDGTMAVQLLAVDRRAMNRTAVLLQLIEQNEPHASTRDAAKEGAYFLAGVLNHYPIKKTPEPATA